MTVIQALRADDHPAWPILIVDDDEQVHASTRFSLRAFHYEGGALEFVSSYSCAEAKELLSKRHDFAVALVDVQMETKTAGLELVEWIRDELGEEQMRIVLRTGQPGEYDQLSIVEEFDINDYREKSSLTNKGLHTLIHSSLKTYCDLEFINSGRKGLKEIVSSLSEDMSYRSLKHLSHGVLEQLAALLHTESCLFYSEAIVRRADYSELDGYVVASTGDYKNLQDQPFSSLYDALSTPKDVLDSVLKQGLKSVRDNVFLGGYITPGGHRSLMVINTPKEHKLNPVNIALIDIYGSHVSMAFENIAYRDEVNRSQVEMLFRLGDVIDSCSKDTGSHVRRMALSCRAIGEAMGFDAANLELLYKASALHDVGKVGIPVEILNRDGPLLDDEWALVKQHTTWGAEIFASSNSELFRLAASIALNHHENWDGSGYPQGIKGKAIPLVGRIAAVADVWDALVNKRCYKDDWAYEDVFDFLLENKGTKFDPEIVDVALSIKDELITIQMDDFVQADT
ncbi:HD domain-containing phosphohydrolase [Agaribacterium sp. ZY112]|uniref:HD domain-containing phosphohydrolase n=1 Tax=Agaribacterium sp. ZY112 TaxID=3233574 RepID=UPI003525E7F4